MTPGAPAPAPLQPIRAEMSNGNGVLPQSKKTKSSGGLFRRLRRNSKPKTSSNDDAWFAPAATEFVGGAEDEIAADQPAEQITSTCRLLPYIHAT